MCRTLLTGSRREKMTSVGLRVAMVLPLPADAERLHIEAALRLCVTWAHPQDSDPIFHTNCAKPVDNAPMGHRYHVFAERLSDLPQTRAAHIRKAESGELPRRTLAD
jgi:hypothetical protein